MPLANLAVCTSRWQKRTPLPAAWARGYARWRAFRIYLWDPLCVSVRSYVNLALLAGYIRFLAHFDKTMQL